MNNLVSDLTSMEGRINRQRWWIGVIVLAVVGIILNFIVGAIMGTGMMMSPTDLAAPGTMQKLALTGLIVSVILAYPQIALSVKRRHDRGNNGYDAIGIIVVGLLYNLVGAVGMLTMGGPVQVIFLIVLGVAGIYLLIQLGFLRGTAGPNQYGPDPLQG